MLSHADIFFFIVRRGNHFMHGMQQLLCLRVLMDRFWLKLPCNIFYADEDSL